MKRKDNLLVSVCVLAYNSKKYILETLNSIKNQTYDTIELIISDDCSTDDTVALCTQWINRNFERFVNVKIITSTVNSGISANCNRAYNAANGKWIKGIAGDDLLLSNCITDNVNYVNGHEEIHVLLSDTVYFKNTKTGVKLLEHYHQSAGGGFWNKTAAEQHKLLYQKNYAEAPTLFIKSEICRMYPFNEKYKMIEDYPFWLTLTANGIKLYHISIKTVMYRLEDSATRSSKLLYREKYEDSFRLFYLLELKDTLYYHHHDIYKEFQIHFLCYDLALLLFKNRKNIITKIVNKTIRVILNFLAVV